MKSAPSLFVKVAPQIINVALRSGFLRKLAAAYAKRYAFQHYVERDHGYTPNIWYERYVIAVNLIETLERALTNRNISASVRKKLIDLLVGRILLKNTQSPSQDSITEFGQNPPVLSPSALDAERAGKAKAFHI